MKVKVNLQKTNRVGVLVEVKNVLLVIVPRRRRLPYRCIDGMTLLRINYQAKRDKVLSEWNYENTLMQDIQLTDIEIISNNHGYEKVPVDSLRYQDDKRFYKLNCYPTLSILTTKPELRMRTEIDTEFKDRYIVSSR